MFNSLWPSDAIWWHRSGSTMAQVMACCLTAPSHYLNQCWLIISEIIPMYRLWLHGLYGLYAPRCPLSPKRLINLISLSLWSSLKFSDIHIRAISQDMPQPSVNKIHLKITYLKFHSNFPGANKLSNGSVIKAWGILWHCTQVNVTGPY